MKQIKAALFALILFSVAVSAIICAPAAHAQKNASTVEDVLQRGVLRVGFSTFVPWAMQDKNGNFIGYEIDVAQRLANDMGVKLELVPTKWSGIIPALLTGKFDVIIGSMGIKPERNAKVNFTIPYEYSGMAIVANKKGGEFHSLEDFNRPEIVIAARTGSSGVEAARKFLPKATLRMFDEEPQAVQELLTGRANAFVSSAPLPAQLAAKYPDTLYLPVPGTFTKEGVGFAVRKGDVDTLNYFDNWIRARDLDGWLKDRQAYWFESVEWEKDLK